MRPDGRYRIGCGDLTASVAICAYTMGRWDNLVAAVSSVVPQLHDGDEVVVVIDHNDELLSRAEATFTGAQTRVVSNAGPAGLSGARNSAILASRGEILAFLDDDAVADARWLDRMRAALADPDVMAVGTAAIPEWPDGRRPSWFPPEFDWVIGCSYAGLPLVAADVRNVIGAAMAFRREAFDIVGGFSTLVGRIGSTPTGCEETELCIRLRRAKPTARITYLPDVAVSHTVTAERLRLTYFLKRCVGEGLSKARISRLVGAGDGLASERAYVSATLPRALLRELGRAVRGDLAGLAKSIMIVAGTLVTGLAYLAGRLDRRSTLTQTGLRVSK